MTAARTTIVLAAMLGGALIGQDSRPASRPESRRVGAILEVDVDGTKREALLFKSPGAGAAPLVLAFHGHGGSARQAASNFRIQEEWKDAIVAYPDGLPTPLPKFDPEGKWAGWQVGPGQQGDRDLKFVDALVGAIRKAWAVDPDRVYAMGHSNGAAFTYLLWAKRPEMLAACAASAGGSWSAVTLTPKPAMHIAGRADTLVPMAGQQRTMLAVRAINGCTLPARPWAPQCTYFPSTKGTPFVSFIHDGDHAFPESASAMIVRFFQEHPRTAATTPRRTR